MRRMMLAALVAFSAPAAAQIAATPGAAASEPVDPARLVVATRIVGKVFPTGTYQRMMGENLRPMLDSITDMAGAMPLRQVAALGGLSEERSAELGDATLAEIMAIHDPAYRERMQIGMRATMDAMTGLMTQFEPQVQQGLARAFARRFDAKQLSELDAFFATPTGAFYARESMTLFMDPELMQQMQAFMPAMMEAMPKVTQAAEAATARLPKPKTIAELTPAERAKLAKLLGVQESALRDPPADTLTGDEDE